MLRLGVLQPGLAGEAARLERLTPDGREFVTELARRQWVTRLQAVQIGRSRGHHLLVGQYLLLDRLGSGGMGRVFLARHRGLGRIAALKLVRKDRRHCPATRARFLREVRLVARLNHENVVHAHDAGFDHGAFYLVMEYVPGPDLGRVIVSEGALDFGRACEYARQAALGLQHVHDQGLVHRDVKPSNLGLAAGGRVVKVLDVGLARTPGNQDPGLSGVGRLIGSADYTAPEQVVDSQRVDRRADLYALGCTLYHLLTGQVPFPDGTAVQKARRHLSEVAQPVEDVRPGIPAGLGDVVRRLMARRRKNRFQTATEAAEALTPFAVPLTVPVRAAGATPNLPTAIDLPTLPEERPTGRPRKSGWNA